MDPIYVFTVAGLAAAVTSVCSITPAVIILRRMQARGKILDAHIKRLQDTIEQQDQRLRRLDDLAADLVHIRADIDWMASEQIVDRAVAMVRSGAGAEDISSETGVTLDEARALQKLRRH